MIARIKIYAALVGLFLTTLLVTWFGGRITGAANTKAKQVEGRIKTMKHAEDIANEVEALDVDTLKRRSVKWVRKSNK